MPKADAQVEDLVLDNDLHAYLVRPREAVTGPAVMFLHWFDEAPNANRTQYLGEASALASLGIVSLLPQLRFPWETPPTDSVSDLDRIGAEREALQSGVASLLQLNSVDPDRLAVVGHDFGAMHGTLLLREVKAQCAVLVAPTARWADWFLSFWPISTDRYEYMRALDPVDPINALPDAGCPLLLQFARNDFYIAPMTGMAMLNAASEPKQMEIYECGHQVDVEKARTDRLTFLREHLSI